MPDLTPQERSAGRAFRAAKQAELTARHEKDPPTFVVPVYLAVWRHECIGARHTSEHIVLMEHYERSPEYQVEDRRTGAVTTVPAGLFAFLWRQGACRTCRATARSDGRVVLAAERAPLEARRSG